MSSPAEAVIDELRACVGKTTRTRLGATSAVQFQRYARAVGDPNPAYGSGAVALPLFVSSIFGWNGGPWDDELRHDGTTGAETMGLPLDGLRLMGAGQDLEFFEPVFADVHLNVDLVLEDVELKRGRSGDFLLIVLSRSFRDADGRLLLSCRDRFIAR